MRNRSIAFLFATVLSMSAATTGGGSLRVGAAKVDITPPSNPAQPPSGRYEHEHLFVRAIVLDNGVPFTDSYLADPRRGAGAGKSLGERIKAVLAYLP